VERAERPDRASRPNFDAPRRDFGAPAAPRKDFSAAPRHDAPRKDFGAPRAAAPGARPTLGADRAPRPSVAPAGRGWR
jgi:hypothetical protein